MVTDYQIIKYIHDNMNEEYKNILNTRIKFIDRFKHLFSKSDLWVSNESVKLVKIELDDFKITYGFDKLERLNYASIDVCWSNAIVYRSSDHYTILPELRYFCNPFESVRMSFYTDKIYFNGSVLDSETLLGNVTGYIQTIYPFDLDYVYFDINLFNDNGSLYLKVDPVYEKRENIIYRTPKLLGYFLNKDFHCFNELIHDCDRIHDDIPFLIEQENRENKNERTTE